MLIGTRYWRVPVLKWQLLVQEALEFTLIFLENLCNFTMKETFPFKIMMSCQVLKQNRAHL